MPGVHYITRQFRQHGIPEQRVLCDIEERPGLFLVDFISL
jgi:hypothetical protein